MASAHTSDSPNQPGTPPKSAATPPHKPLANEEPPLALEPDLPSDGRDEEGEAMIRDLPQRPELSEPRPPDPPIRKP